MESNDTTEILNTDANGSGLTTSIGVKEVFNHPEVFTDPKRVLVKEDEDRFTYTIDGIGLMSLIKTDYGKGKVLQVDVVEMDVHHQNQGYGTDFYRYVLEHLPTEYSGILSGTITNDRVHSIYKKLGLDYSVEKLGPSGYWVTPKIKSEQ